jgi:hypothetical protein
MRQVWWALVAVVLAGCAEEQGIRRFDPAPAVELSAFEASPQCMPVDAVEVRSGMHDPSAHEVLKSLAAERGSNYVVLDSFGVVAADEDIIAIARARLFRCPVQLACYQCRCLAAQ